MIHVEANREDGVVAIRFAQHVDAEQMRRYLEQIRQFLETMKPGFRLFADLSSLDSMDLDCAPVIGAVMDLCREKGVKEIIRVIPDARKDIGLNLLSHFHYGPEVVVQTYETLAEAQRQCAT